MSTDSAIDDRRGVTGSARLLRDIYQLDQYAFDANKRKLSLSKTVSLARLAPIEFQKFRQTGVITFATPLEMFDRDFPGHYLRLINRVSLSVVALIAPSQNIHATLTSSGLSRVVIGPDIFQRVTVHREPESIALSSPLNATGIFELEQQPELLRPFEGSGVDTIWELRMPRAANPFDSEGIADLLVTIEYSALTDTSYREQIIQSLPRAFGANAAFSFRSQFPDQWFDLLNPDQSPTPMTVSFRTDRQDFPPNLDSLRIENVAIHFSRGDHKLEEIDIALLHFRANEADGGVGAGVRTVGGLASTRAGTGSGWAGLIGQPPTGEWTLGFKNSEDMRARFSSGEILDIMLVLYFSGRTPEWPA